MSAPPIAPRLPGYRDLAPLGRGGHSEVYRAYQEQFDRWVAVKVLAFPLNDESSQRRFLRECRLAGRLSTHPNIVTVYDAGISPDGKPYISMELFPEGSLAGALARGSLEAPEVLRIGIALAGALETAHRAGVVHRDVKPANVLLTSYGQPVLADFGLSVLAERLDGPAGTATSADLLPYYAAPEVIAHSSTTPASDVYSLASIVYTLLAGHAPHQISGLDDTVAALKHRADQRDVPPLAVAGLPQGLVDALHGALARDPGQRPRSALAFALALQDAQRTLGQESTDPVVVEIPTPSDDQPDKPGPAQPFASPVASPSPPPPSPSPPPPMPSPSPSYPTGEITMERPRVQLPPRPTASAQEPPKSRTGLLVVAMVVVLAGLVAGIVVLLTGGSDDGGGGGGGGDGNGTEEQADDSEPPVDVEAPSGLAAVESEAGVQLDWEGDDNANYVVLILSETEQPIPVQVEGTSELIEITELEPDVGYCFTVASEEGLAVASQADQTSEAFSPPECIRGADEDTVLPPTGLRPAPQSKAPNGWSEGEVLAEAAG